MLCCDGHEQALVCLSNREIVDASRGCIFHCKMATYHSNQRFFLYFCGLIYLANLAVFKYNGLCTPSLQVSS